MTGRSLSTRRRKTPPQSAGAAKPELMSRPKAISLFSGAGGLDYGFEAAGFETGVAVEFDHDCCQTMRGSGYIRPDAVIHRSVFDVPTEEMLAVAGCKRGEIDLLIGGPPCQPFSKAGYWASGDAKRLSDPRSDTLGAYLRVLDEAQPRAFLLENVEGLAYSGKDEGLRLLLSEIERINRRHGTNYRPVFRVLNAADYGGPQRRERVFIVAGRDGQTFHFPEPTHRDPELEPTLLTAGLPAHRTAWDALGDVGPAPGEDLTMKGKWADLLPAIPEGENYLWHTPRRIQETKGRTNQKPLFGWRTRYWSFMLKLAKGKPSWTVQAQPGPAIGPFHWENRRLAVRELSRLMTFPDGITFAGTRVSIQRQLGNAVVSLVGEVLGREIRRQLLNEPGLTGPLKLMPPDRGPQPPPESVTRVPAKYLALIGDHEAHPGTGKGRGALRRAEAAV